MTPILFVAVMIGAVALMATAADNTLGTWKYVPAKSKQAAGSEPFASLTITRESVGGAVKFTAKGETASGGTINNAGTVKYDGKPTKMAAPGLWDTVADTQLDANSISEERTKTGGKHHVAARYEVSADGKTMTVKMNGKDETGKAFTRISVFEKQ